MIDLMYYIAKNDVSAWVIRDQLGLMLNDPSTGEWPIEVYLDMQDLYNRNDLWVAAARSGFAIRERMAIVHAFANAIAACTSPENLQRIASRSFQRLMKEIIEEVENAGKE